MKRLSLVVLVIMLLSVVLGACQPAAPTTIKIGLNAELTGSIPVVGESNKNAAEMAVKEVNDAGGLEVGGKKYMIELVVEDNEDKAESAAAAAQKLATAGVLAMIGPNASRNAIPAAVVAESSQMLMISPWSTNPKTTIDEATGQPKKYVFRAAFIDDFQGVVGAKFAMEQLKTTKPAVLYDVASEYNKGIAEIYKKTLEQSGIQVVAFETYTTGDKDFSSQLTKIVEAGADTLYLPNYYSEVPLQVQQAHKVGFTGMRHRPCGGARLRIHPPRKKLRDRHQSHRHPGCDHGLLRPRPLGHVHSRGGKMGTKLVPELAGQIFQFCLH